MWTTFAKNLHTCQHTMATVSRQVSELSYSIDPVDNLSTYVKQVYTAAKPDLSLPVVVSLSLSFSLSLSLVWIAIH